MGNKRSWEALKESFALAGLLMLGGIRGRLCWSKALGFKGAKKAKLPRGKQAKLERRSW